LAKVDWLICAVVLNTMWCSRMLYSLKNGRRNGKVNEPEQRRKMP
jgi:hypothetical protein